MKTETLTEKSKMFHKGYEQGKAVTNKVLDTAFTQAVKEVDYWKTEFEKSKLVNEALLSALKEIAEGKGRYSSDPFTHAINTIDDMKEIARKAIKQAEQ